MDGYLSAVWEDLLQSKRKQTPGLFTLWSSSVGGGSERREGSPIPVFPKSPTQASFFPSHSKGKRGGFGVGGCLSEVGRSWESCETPGKHQLSPRTVPPTGSPGPNHLFTFIPMHGASITMVSNLTGLLTRWKILLPFPGLGCLPRPVWLCQCFSTFQCLQPYHFPSYSQRKTLPATSWRKWSSSSFHSFLPLRVRGQLHPHPPTDALSSCLVIRER